MGLGRNSSKSRQGLADLIITESSAHFSVAQRPTPCQGGRTHYDWCGWRDQMVQRASTCRKNWGPCGATAAGRPENSLGRRLNAYAGSGMDLESLNGPMGCTIGGR